MVRAYHVERAVAVAATQRCLYGLVADLRRWDEWSPWHSLDPDLRQTYSGEPSGTGARYAWSGNRKAGRGRMEIVDTHEFSAITLEVAFRRPFPSRSTSAFAFTRGPTETQVRWQVSGAMPPLLRMLPSVVSMERLLGGDLERGLDRLKEVAETADDAGGSSAPDPDE